MYRRRKPLDGRLDCLDPDKFKYEITSKEITPANERAFQATSSHLTARPSEERPIFRADSFAISCSRVQWPKGPTESCEFVHDRNRVAVLGQVTVLR